MVLNKADFDRHAQRGANRIPLMREVLADLDTPLSTYLKLAYGPYSYLFESVQGGEKWGRYSIIGLPCRMLLRVFGNEIRLEHDGEVITRETVADPLEYIREFRQRYEVPADSRPAALHRRPGWLLWLRHGARYRAGAWALAQTGRIGGPDILLMVSDEVVGVRQPGRQSCMS